MQFSDANTAVQHMNYWYVFVVLRKFYVAVQKSKYSRCTVTHDC